MAEETLANSSSDNSFVPSRSTRRKIVYATLLFCGALISYIVYAGSSENSLHTSAMSWAFTTALAVIGAYVFGAVYDNSNVLKNFQNNSK